MLRSKGLLNVSANFEPKMAAPLDARQVVYRIKNLIDLEGWASADGSVYVYKGMKSIVIDDEEENNGLYVLVSEDCSDMNNWIKIKEDDGTPYDEPELNNAPFVVTIEPGNWLGTGPYTKTISVPGIKTDHIPRWDILLGGSDYTNEVNTLAAWDKIYHIEISTDEITLYATAPTEGIQIEICCYMASKTKV